MGQLALGQLIEKVALVLPAVLPPQEAPAPGGGVKEDIGVMPGGESAGALFQGPVQQGAEFDGAVAVQTGVGSAAPGVLGGKAVHYGGLEQGAEIQDAVGDVQHCGGGPGGLYGLVLRASGPRVARLQPQGNTKYVIAHLQQQKRGAGAVHTAAHCHTDPFGSHEKPSLCSRTSETVPIAAVHRPAAIGTVSEAIVIPDGKKRKASVCPPYRNTPWSLF